MITIYNYHHFLRAIIIPRVGQTNNLSIVLRQQTIGSTAFFKCTIHKRLDLQTVNNARLTDTNKVSENWHFNLMI